MGRQQARQREKRNVLPRGQVATPQLQQQQQQPQDLGAVDPNAPLPADDVGVSWADVKLFFFTWAALVALFGLGGYLLYEDEYQRQLQDHLMNKGMTSTQEGRWEESIASFTAVLEKDRDHIVALTNRGMAYAKLGQVRDPPTASACVAPARSTACSAPTRAARRSVALCHLLSSANLSTSASVVCVCRIRKRCLISQRRSLPWGATTRRTVCARSTTVGWSTSA